MMDNTLLVGQSQAQERATAILAQDVVHITNQLKNICTDLMDLQVELLGPVPIANESEEDKVAALSATQDVGWLGGLQDNINISRRAIKEIQVIIHTLKKM